MLLSLRRYRGGGIGLSAGACGHGDMMMKFSRLYGGGRISRPGRLVTREDMGHIIYIALLFFLPPPPPSVMCVTRLAFTVGLQPSCSEDSSATEPGDS